ARPRVARARAADRRHRDLRADAGHRHRPGGHRHGADPDEDGEAMTLSLASPMALEAALGVVLLAVFVGALLARGEDRRGLAWLATIGVLAVGVLSMFARPAGPALGGMFVQDGLAIFAKRLFLAATFIGLLAGMSGGGRDGLARRAGEYHVLMLASLLGMLALASARDLVLLFVAFELMSLPLYVLAGF